MLAKDSPPKDLWDRVEHTRRGFQRRQDSLCRDRQGAADGDDPRLSGLLVHLAQADGRAQRHYRVVAMDQRGYDLSGRPAGIEQYAMPLLVNDIGAVIKAEGRSSAVIVGHDWGGAVAWTLAMTHPEWIQALIILNLPHPSGIQREIKNNPEQRKNSQYAFNFQKPGAEKNLTSEKLAGLGQRRCGARALY